MSAHPPQLFGPQSSARLISRFGKPSCLAAPLRWYQVGWPALCFVFCGKTKNEMCASCAEHLIFFSYKLLLRAVSPICQDVVLFVALLSPRLRVKHRKGKVHVGQQAQKRRNGTGGAACGGLGNRRRILTRGVGRGWSPQSCTSRRSD